MTTRKILDKRPSFILFYFYLLPWQLTDESLSAVSKTLPFILHSLCISQPPQQNCFSFSFLFFLFFFTSLSPLLVLSKEYLLLKSSEYPLLFFSILFYYHFIFVTTYLPSRSDELILFFTRFEDR